MKLTNYEAETGQAEAELEKRCPGKPKERE